jgi:hypothetical protein
MVIRSYRLVLTFILAAATGGCSASSPLESQESAIARADCDLAGSNRDFYSSFEPGDPQPAWTDAVEVDAHGTRRTSGVTGTPNTLILGNIMSQVVEVTASGDNPPNETAARIADGEAAVSRRTGACRHDAMTPS